MNDSDAEGRSILWDSFSNLKSITATGGGGSLHYRRPKFYFIAGGMADRTSSRLFHNDNAIFDCNIFSKLRPKITKYDHQISYWRNLKFFEMKSFNISNMDYSVVATFV